MNSYLDEADRKHRFTEEGLVSKLSLEKVYLNKRFALASVSKCFLGMRLPYGD
jgi:hypothetical protein